MKDTLSKFKQEDFLNEMSSRFKNILSQLTGNAIAVEIIMQEMALYPAHGLVAKDGNTWDRTLLQKIANEIRVILCTEETKYADLKQNIQSQEKISLRCIIELISGSIGKNIGVADAVCKPFVTLMLASIIKTGVDTFCQLSTNLMNAMAQNKT